MRFRAMRVLRHQKRSSPQADHSQRRSDRRIEQSRKSSLQYRRIKATVVCALIYGNCKSLLYARLTPDNSSINPRSPHDGHLSLWEGGEDNDNDGKAKCRFQNANLRIGRKTAGERTSVRGEPQLALARVMARIRWNVRQLLGITALIAILCVLWTLPREKTQIPLLAATASVLVVAAIFEQRIPGWAKIILTIAFVATVVNALLPVVY